MGEQNFAVEIDKLHFCKLAFSKMYNFDLLNFNLNQLLFFTALQSFKEQHLDKQCWFICIPSTCIELLIVKHLETVGVTVYHLQNVTSLIYKRILVFSYLLRHSVVDLRNKLKAWNTIFLLRYLKIWHHILKLEFCRKLTESFFMGKLVGKMTDQSSFHLSNQ